MRAEAKITAKGQLTLPAKVREKLGVSVGDRVLFWQDGKGLRVSAIASTLADLRGIVKSVPHPLDGDTVSRWIAEARDAGWRDEPSDR